MNTITVTREQIDELARKLTEEGKLIEAGWVGLMLACNLFEASEVQKREMKKAFFAGAQHLFGSLMSVLDPDSEPTDKDLEMMNLIHTELMTWITEFKQGTFQ